MLHLLSLDTERGFGPLSWRYRPEIKSQWPMSYRFQTSRRSWRVKVVCDSENAHGRVQDCVLQMATEHDERTLEKVSLDIKDAETTASYAHRFNVHQLQNEGADGPNIKVAAPVSCEVVESGFPSMVPRGSFCSISPYRDTEVQKFVFDGSEEFLELPQAFFHFAVYASGGKEFVCDLQGSEDEDGGIVLIDPCVLRSKLPTVGDIITTVSTVAAGPTDPDEKQILMQGPSGGTTEARFEELHPQCGPLCKAFDPHRQSARKCKSGMCGSGISCGF